MPMKYMSRSEKKTRLEHWDHREGLLVARPNSRRELCDRSLELEPTQSEPAICIRSVRMHNHLLSHVYSLAPFRICIF